MTYVYLRQQLDVMMFLLKNGAMAEINAVDASGETALHYCVRSGLPDHAQVPYYDQLSYELLRHTMYYRIGCVLSYML